MNANGIKVELVSTIKWEQYQFNNPQEEEQARKLSPLQRRHIENIIGMCIEEKLGLIPEDGKDREFQLRHEFLRGQVSILQYILQLDSSAQQEKVT